jgi:ABC-type Fe3+/spermidine/putrescine transport system ATPase subunit
VNVPAIFITHDQEEALELGDRVAVINQGHIEQIGTPFEIYSKPATEYVATFLGAANLLDAVVRDDYLEVGTARVPVDDKEQFKEGTPVKIVFRPEDVSLSKTEFLRPGHHKISTALVEEISFVGAYERLRLRLEEGAEEMELTATRSISQPIPRKASQANLSLPRGLNPRPQPPSFALAKG